MAPSTTVTIPETRRVAYLDGAYLRRIEGRVSFIEDGKRREVVIEATDGSAAFIPARLIVAIDDDTDEWKRGAL